MCGLHWKRCLVYIDDILVFGNDFESALHSLELVLNRVAEYGLQLKSTKCNLFRTSVPFLGHIAFPKEDLPYIVDTDASDYGIGGVLSQCIEGTEHVIAYYS